MAGRTLTLVGGLAAEERFLRGLDPDPDLTVALAATPGQGAVIGELAVPFLDALTGTADSARLGRDPVRRDPRGAATGTQYMGHGGPRRDGAARDHPQRLAGEGGEPAAHGVGRQDRLDRSGPPGPGLRHRPQRRDRRPVPAAGSDDGAAPPRGRRPSRGGAAGRDRRPGPAGESRHQERAGADPERAAPPRPGGTGRAGRTPRRVRGAQGDPGVERAVPRYPGSELRPARARGVAGAVRRQRRGRRGAPGSEELVRRSARSSPKPCHRWPWTASCSGGSSRISSATPPMPPPRAGRDGDRLHRARATRRPGVGRPGPRRRYRLGHDEGPARPRVRRVSTRPRRAAPGWVSRSSGGWCSTSAGPSASKPSRATRHPRRPSEIPL